MSDRTQIARLHPKPNLGDDHENAFSSPALLGLIATVLLISAHVRRELRKLYRARGRGMSESVAEGTTESARVICCVSLSRSPANQ